MAKLTWTDQQNIAQELSGLTDSATLAHLKRDMNTGAALFMAGLNREYNRHSRFTNLVANQQYYQIPEDAFMLKEVVVSSGTYNPPMEQIPDEFAWRQMNSLPVQGLPSHYFVRGRNEFGLYPIPANSVTSGIELVFAPKNTQMTENDFGSAAGLTGTGTTVAVTNGSQTITHSATGFTAKMVGQWFSVTDGSDENWYQITGYTSSSVMTIENYFQGLSNNTVNFRIGQVMDLPEEFLEAPVDYAIYRFYLKRGIIGLTQANEFKALFDGALQAAKDLYGQVSESQVINATPQFRTYNPFRGDPPSSISA